MFATIAAVGAGGALGAISRYGVGLVATYLAGPSFPWGTLTVNIVGSFIMGLMIAIFAHFWQPPEAWRLFLVTGFLGGFTTFSTFSLDIVTLYERGDVYHALLYGMASIVLSVSALFVGMLLVRSFSS